jgi:hypothetical protein
VLRAAALNFHPREAQAEDTGMVLPRWKRRKRDSIRSRFWFPVLIDWPFYWVLVLRLWSC